MDSAIQAHRNEFESERARLSWADTSSPLPNLESLNSQTPLIRTSRVSVLSGLNLEKNAEWSVVDGPRRQRNVQKKRGARAKLLFR